MKNKTVSRKKPLHKGKVLDTFVVMVYSSKGDDMEKIVEQGLLYDFYGELLTDHQRSIYEDAVFGDLSLGEIAREYNISRQGVHDLIKRCDNSLQDYENKLHLMQKFISIKQKVKEIDELTGNASLSREELAKKMKEIAGQILEEL